MNLGKFWRMRMLITGPRSMTLWLHETGSAKAERDLLSPIIGRCWMWPRPAKRKDRIMPKLHPALEQLNRRQDS